MTKLTREEKYSFYEASVQNPEADIEFINKEYNKIYNRNPVSLREDFCGTGMLACMWVKQSENHRAYGIDLDLEPITYGIDHHYFELSHKEQSQMRYIRGNVLDNYDFKTEVLVAFNFSYYLFKDRNLLLQYFKNARKHLAKDGLFLIDLFGGLETRQALEEKKKFKTHTYIWDCEKYNPLTSDVFYSIHFIDHKKKKTYKRVFEYDWRMWDAKELLDVLKDAGFSHSQIYWEGVDKDGYGNGKFKVSNKAENCESWVTYIVSKP